MAGSELSSRPLICNMTTIIEAYDHPENRHKIEQFKMVVDSTITLS